MKLVDEFFEFETKNKLFDIKDKNDLVPWESIRYFVFYHIFWTKLGTQNEYFGVDGKRKNIFTRIKKVLQFFIYLFTHRKCKRLFLLCSRDRKGNIMYDKITDGFYMLSNVCDNFLIETTDSWIKPNYKYINESTTTIIISILERFMRRRRYSAVIDDIIQRNYPEIKWNFNELHRAYQVFLAQYYFYSFIFKVSKIKKIFMVQNGIQKGFFAAAKKRKIWMAELQHGQFSKNHIAYSYPQCVKNNPEIIYQPNYLLTFGEFWMKGYLYPGVTTISLGNNSYGEKNIDSQSIEKYRKKILVISNEIIGDFMAESVMKILSHDCSFEFYFKLHPHEYAHTTKYERFFHNINNVKVITNENTINDLLRKSEFVFLTDSTVELEALEMGRKVIVIKKYSYEIMDFVFNEKGIYFIDEAEEFISCYNAHKDEQLEPRNDIFQPFDKEKALELLKC